MSPPVLGQHHTDLNALAPASSASPPQTFADRTKPATFSACDFVLDTQNYIPAGALRIERYSCQISTAAWRSCVKWQALAHPREVSSGAAGDFVPASLQELLFSSAYLAPYRPLQQAGWIRLEFKIMDAEWGQIRVYILPDDVGNRTIDRNHTVLRRCLRSLLTHLDMSQLTWLSRWSQFDPMIHIHEVLDTKENQISLFNLYNTLPSPKPDPDVVQDPDARSAMRDILSCSIEGLKTTMMAYQRRSAALMLQRESQPAQIVDPRLRPLMDQDGRTWYCDMNTGTCMRNPRMYEASRGGILSETMGYGMSTSTTSAIS
jgi:hypothetical protein